MVVIQNITLEHTSRGVTQEWVYKNIIKPTYFISRATYYSYLRTPAKAEIKKATHPTAEQKCLF